MRFGYKGSDYLFWTDRLIEIINRLFLFVALLALASLVIKYGFYIPHHIDNLIDRIDLLVVWFYLIQFVTKFMLSRKKKQFLKTHWFEALLSLFIVGETVLLLSNFGIGQLFHYFTNIRQNIVTRTYVIITQILILSGLLPWIIRYNQRLSQLKIHPAQLVLFGFSFAIVIGTFLLKLPRAVVPPAQLTFIDALFTSTSAVCVTGLVVVDTGSYFSTLGQVILLGLIQLGGLGIMTVAAFLALFFRKGIGLREHIILQDFLNAEVMASLTKIIRNIVIITVSIEIMGALLIGAFWSQQDWPFSRVVFYSVFHSVSAFCNAGFALFSDSLMQFDNNATLTIIFSSIIILGGIGFLTIMDVGNRCMPGLQPCNGKKLKVNSKLVLLTTAVLLLVGIVGYLVIEYPLHAENRALSQGLLDAFFMSVTSRTAGFNMVDISELSPAFSFVVIILMFIGASPGSTGGGIKTTTFTVLWLAILAIINGRKRVIISGKRVPFFVLNRAIVVVVLSISVISISTLLLLYIERGDFLTLFFEVVSAFATVGLSKGATASLSTASKCIVIACMFIGRMGIITVAFAITSPSEERIKIEYPSEVVIVG